LVYPYIYIIFETDTAAGLGFEGVASFESDDSQSQKTEGNCLTNPLRIQLN